MKFLISVEGVGVEGKKRGRNRDDNDNINKIFPYNPS